MCLEGRRRHAYRRTHAAAAPLVTRSQTAHMADHSLGPAWYGLRAVRVAAGTKRQKRTRLQLERLPDVIRELVLSARESLKFAGW